MSRSLRSIQSSRSIPRRESTPPTRKAGAAPRIAPSAADPRRTIPPSAPVAIRRLCDRSAGMGRSARISPASRRASAVVKPGRSGGRESRTGTGRPAPAALAQGPRASRAAAAARAFIRSGGEAPGGRAESRETLRDRPSPGPRRCSLSEKALIPARTAAAVAGQVNPTGVRPPSPTMTAASSMTTPRPRVSAGGSWSPRPSGARPAPARGSSGWSARPCGPSSRPARR